ncbi:MAG TPA: iron-containing alcohol dehydrogenase [Anaerolineae bacterium]|nr:iron-containing alcohol dehydrogenase [Anaerolineae bacterium]HQI86153.1 iron-containing alcohol dehydrogenase [Anaerolineae bacterium]
MKNINHNQVFNFPAINTEVLFGFGVLAQLPEKVAELGGKRVLIVTDKGVQAAGIVDQVVKVLTEAWIPAVVFDEVPQDSGSRTVERAVDVLRAEGCDLVVGVGGGSSLDAAKAVAFGATNPPPVAQYAGLNKLKQPGLPMIAIPTTAGTGSEVSYWSVMTDDDTQVKIGIGGALVFPRVALADPALTLSLPPFLTATTGMDALTHAIESYTNRSYQPISAALTYRAIELIGEFLVRAVQDGADREARYGMLLGSLLAGMGMNPTRLGIVHALAMPLGSWQLKIAHGTGNAVLLPHVMAFNQEGNPTLYADVARALGVGDADPRTASQVAIARVRAINAESGIPAGLGVLGLTEALIPQVCAEAIKSGNIAVNPRACSQADLEGICRAAL